MEDNTETTTTADATDDDTPSGSPNNNNSKSNDPNYTVNIREVKHKTLALLTELYRTETGDVKRMAMSLLQTLYTITEPEQVAEMNGKIQKLMKLIEEQKREQAELEEASLAGSHDTDSSGFHIMGGAARSRALTEESNVSDKIVGPSIVSRFAGALNKDDNSSTSRRWRRSSFKSTQSRDDDSCSESTNNNNNNNILKRWQEKLENLRKQEPKTTDPNEEETSSETNNNNNKNGNNNDNNWRESMTTRMDESRQRLANGWRESTTKIQQGLKQRGNRLTLEAKPTEDSSSVSTEGSSNPSSPNASQAAASNDNANNKEEDLLHVIRNFVKDGVDSKKSRDSLEMALNIRREKARNRWAEARAKWKWPNANATAQAQES